jgi:hypothetical protein
VRDAPLPPALAAGLVFLASGAVLVLEILGIACSRRTSG